MESVLQNDKKCVVCGKKNNLNSHHIFPGSRRGLSEKYGFKVWLCVNHHTLGRGSVHDNPNHGLDLQLKQKAQRYFEENIGDRDEFREIFGKSWL